MERQRFEDSWKEAFKDAEVSPSENLWTNIELDLEKAEGKKMKKRVLYFKLLAAASVAFAMTFAGVGYVYMNDQNDKLVAQNNGSQNSATENRAAKITEAATEVESNATNEENTKGESNDAAIASSASIDDPSKQDAAVDKSSVAIADNSAQHSAATNEANQTSANNGSKSKSGNQSDVTKDSGLNNQTPRRDQIAQQSISPKGDKGASQMFDSASERPSDIQNPTRLTVAAASAQNAAEDERLFANARLPEIVHLRKPAYHHAKTESEIDPVKAMLERLAAEEQKYASNKKSKEDKRSKKGGENLWTSVGFAAGSFNTVVSGNGVSAINSDVVDRTAMYATDGGGRKTIGDEIVNQQSKASGVSYAIGLSLGGKLSDRWVLQGGVNYLTQSSDYRSNAVVSDFENFKTGSINELNNASKGDQLMNSASYNVNSNLRYLNVPLQAGYLIVNRDFGLQLNAGVSTDLFLQSTLTPEGGSQQINNAQSDSQDSDVSYISLPETKQGPGEDSPYRTLNFSGLISTELSYRFGQHYRLAVNPGLRYPFSSIYKSDIAIDAMPLTFDVGLKFRYIFN